MIRVGILTVSDRVSRGEAEDRSGAAVAEWCRKRGHPIARQATVPDGTGSIVPVLLEWCDSGEVDLLITTGGTGFTPRDLTPEATRAVIDRPAVGVADALRRGGEASTAFAVISRGEAGVRGETVIVNLPGSPAAVLDGLSTLEPLAPHLARLAAGESGPHPTETVSSRGGTRGDE